MIDQNLSAKAQEPEPAFHPCNNPNLSPEEFLHAVMHDDTFSIAVRVKAAKALTLIHTKAPQPPITIRIRDPYGDQYIDRFPMLKAYIQ
jgi:hypothetical protein